MIVLLVRFCKCIVVGGLVSCGVGRWEGFMWLYWIWMYWLRLFERVGGVLVCFFCFCLWICDEVFDYYYVFVDEVCCFEIVYWFDFVVGKFCVVFLLVLFLWFEDKFVWWLGLFLWNVLIEFKYVVGWL